MAGGAQSWKSIVEEIAGPGPDPVVYVFSGEGTDGVFKEHKSHGAYDGDNEDE